MTDLVGDKTPADVLREAGAPASHEPGPWEWREHGGRLMLGTLHHGFKVVLSVNRRGQLETRDRNGILRALEPEHPNARLIATAPELLAALEAWSAQYPNEISSIMEQTRKAIAKATAPKAEPKEPSHGG